MNIYDTFSGTYDTFQSRITRGDLQRFTDGHLAKAIWALLGDNTGINLADAKTKVDPETLERMETDCAGFLNHVGDVIKATVAQGRNTRAGAYEQAGANFWLARNHRSGGFLDGEYAYALPGINDVGEHLAAVSKMYVEYPMFLQSNGIIYGYPPPNEA